MHSEVPRHIKVTTMLGLFSDLMMFTIVNESLSINYLMFCKENNSTVSMHYQQNEKSTQNNPWNIIIDATDHLLIIQPISKK